MKLQLVSSLVGAVAIIGATSIAPTAATAAPLSVTTPAHRISDVQHVGIVKRILAPKHHHHKRRPPPPRHRHHH